MAKILDLAISAQDVIVSYCLRDKLPNLTRVKDLRWSRERCRPGRA
ncbi:MAG TPA: hypothetical protein VGD71_11040 [Kribbella sp.]|jgi:hypothetical protein